ncbi:MAG: GntR family transcriptional regulator [Anaerolineaceae bacterium]|nr:GntR family transcriptional regulator [Anaerolineaceae bacterium]
MDPRPYSFRTKEEYAFQALRQAILDCKLPPGEKLVIDRLSAKLGLSPIPVRAAVQRLHSEGLVMISPHSSATIAPLPPEKVNEVFVLLESLERTAFRAAADRVSPADLQDLESLLQEMDAAQERPDPDAWLSLNIAFHRKIAAVADMPLLLSFTNRVLDEWERISHYYYANITSKRLPQAQADHRQIVALLRSGDALGLDALAIAHNRAANQAYQATLTES